MSRETPVLPPSSEPPKALPPVQPPSGRFIMQLFLVPGLIVLVAVLLLLAFRYAIGTGYSPANFLKQLDHPNADIRWRGASDLAQVLKRPESVNLKTDAAFALDLAQRLKTAFDDLVFRERDLAEKMMKKPEEERAAAWRRLRAERDHVRFLAASLGDFYVPVGAPVLAEIALYEKSPDVQGNTLRRRQAVWALGHMGANMREFVKQPAEKRAEILEVLETAAASDDPRRVSGARTALYYVAREKLSEAEAREATRIDGVLAGCARAEDQYLREQVALAISFWEGPDVVPTLAELARDNGWGTLIRIPEGE